MTRIKIASLAEGSCRVTHAPSGAEITTSSPPQFGGSGGSFSATDLLAAALGVCITTNIESVAERHGLPLDALEVTVNKVLCASPKRLDSLSVVVKCSVPITSDLRVKLERAAERCPVRASLHPDVSVSVAFELVALPPDLVGIPPSSEKIPR